jgi:predicted AAA+ superfamily ATPase
MTLYPRVQFPALKEALDDQRAIVITGMRRTGKTTTLRWLIEQVPSQNKIYLDLERLDQRSVFQESNYDLILDYLRNRGLDTHQPMIVALDEIQYVPNLPSVVKYLYDTYGIKFLLTGSSSFYLKNYFTESLAGRKVVFELFPLTFGEFLDFRGVPYQHKENFE